MPKKAVSATSSAVPIRLEDLGSTAGSQLDFEERRLYARMRPEVWDLAKKIPVYLVSEEQMDAISPPVKVLKNDESVRKWIKEVEEEGELGRKDRWNPPSECLELMVSVGVYCRGGIKEKPGLLPKITDDKAIFICPERVIGWAKREGVDVSVALANVYYHELGHAELDTGSKPLFCLWERIIEESLCNHLSLSQFDTPEEQSSVMRLMDTQPPEYRAYKYFWVDASKWIAVRIMFSRLSSAYRTKVQNKALSLSTEVAEGKLSPELARDRLLAYLFSEPIVYECLSSHEAYSLAEHLIRYPISLPVATRGAYPPAGISLYPREEWRKFKRGDPDALPEEWWKYLAWEMLKLTCV